MIDWASASSSSLIYQMKIIFLALLSVVSAQNHYLRRAKASKLSKSSNDGFVGVSPLFLDQETSENRTTETDPTSVPPKQNVESVNDANLEVSTTPALTQFSIDDSILIATLPTTPKHISISSNLDIDLPIACNDASDCPSEYVACLDESEGNCFFPPCGRCENMDELFENLVSTTSSAATPFETEPIWVPKRIICSTDNRVKQCRSKEIN